MDFGVATTVTPRARPERVSRSRWSGGLRPSAGSASSSAPNELARWRNPADRFCRPPTCPGFPKPPHRVKLAAVRDPSSAVNAPTAVRGVSALVFDAIEQTSRIVEGMHANIAAVSLPLGKGTDLRTRGIARLVYDGIRIVNRSLHAALDGALRLLSSGSDPALSKPQWDAVRSAINGVLGDHLVASANPLAIPMTLRRDGQPLPLDAERLAAALPDATPDVLLLG